jgi:GNAT superfamily N-acetyltransferase
MFDRSLAERRAAAVVPVDGGVAVLDPRFPASHEHNTLWVLGPVDATRVADEAERVLGGAGLGFWRAVLDAPSTVGALAGLGWSVDEQRLMVFQGEPPERSAAVVAVAHEAVARLWSRSWPRDLPGIDDEAVRQLVAREPLADAVMRIVDLAVLGADGDPIASTQLRLDGATAAVEAVMTHPDHRRAGLGRALVLDAVARARDAGADVVFLSAAADDWPRQWYARLGFADLGPRFEATLSPS